MLSRAVAESSEIPVAHDKMNEEESGDSSTVVPHKEPEYCSKIGNSVYLVYWAWARHIVVGRRHPRL